MRACWVGEWYQLREKERSAGFGDVGGVEVGTSGQNCRGVRWCDGTVTIASLWDAHRKGRSTLIVKVTDGVPLGFDASNSTAAWVTATKVSAVVGLERGRIAAVMNGGMGVALVKNAGVMFASRAESSSSPVVTFLRVFQLGTSTSLMARAYFGLNLRGVAWGDPPNNPNCSMVLWRIVPPMKSM